MSSDSEQFIDRNLRGARFNRVDLSQAVMRGVVLDEADIDSPWLCEPGVSLVVNGVDVAPIVDAELNRRFPGRELRSADTPEGLREAWEVLQRAWDAAVARASAMPSGTVDVSVDGEWSFSQTLRHLVCATDTWLRGAVLEVASPYHPIGQPHAEYYTDGYDPSVFRTDTPTFEEVLAVRAERVSMVRDYLAAVSEDELTVERTHPWSPEHAESTLHCLHTILDEEWEHLRYATRDLDSIRHRPAG